ncbi:transporter substrate-binding domain-containing protein [Mycobacterium sp. DL592]|uniref:transporter substrate-binding domain-containing protein n=1 Tax=Mycobacterium sp. DL592 TaxID=2675524 RepID=UPI0014216E76|nr:transporter substrate-binding domain-containing protein [Mycobacterium sp. DL592]
MRNHLRRWLLFAVVAALAAVVAACSGGSKNVGPTVEDIKAAGKIRIATFGDLPPYGYVKNNGTRSGFDIALGNRIAKDLGVTPEWIQVNADSRVDALKSDKVDLVLANFTVTDERKQVVDFANPYMKVSIGVASPDDALITDPAQLNGKQLAVTKGTTAENYFTQNFPDVKLVKFDSKTQQFQAFKDRRVAALADDNSYLFAWAKDNPGFSVGIKELGPQSFIAPAVKKGDSNLLDWVNNEITNLVNTGFLDEAYNVELKPFFTGDIKPQDILIAKS